MDNIGVTGYMVTESGAVPPAASTGWSGTAPTVYTASAAGAKTLYGWAKDAAGNVSAPAIAATTVAGINTILWRNTATGENMVWYMNGATHIGLGTIAAHHRSELEDRGHGRLQ